MSQNIPMFGIQSNFMINKKIVAFCVIAFLCASANAQEQPDFVSFINSEHGWVDSVFRKLSKKQRIAQLFLVRAHTNRGEKYIDSVARVLRKEQLGGAVLFQGGPVRHANMINKYQKNARVPLLMALDGEWGLGMRLADSTVSFPYQMTLGAIQDEDLIYRMGREVGKDFNRLGLHVNFAPVVDVNNNPRNPVINYRSFGENKENVARKGLAYMRGLMDERIIVSLKHFPGHGDTDVDSHYDLPQLNFTKSRLDSLEIDPFRQLIAAGASGVMVAHMHIPSLDSTANLPSTLSKPIVTGLLKGQLGFRGLAFTDAMDMKGVVKFFPDGEADVRAVIAGNDVLELSENSKRAIAMIRRAIRKKQITQDEIDTRVKKVLAAKYWLKLHEKGRVQPISLFAELNRPEAQKLNQQLADAAVTLLKGDSAITRLDYSQPTAIISIGADSITPFQQQLTGRFPENQLFTLPVSAGPEEISRLSDALGRFGQVIVALHDPRMRPQSNLNYSNPVKLLISELAGNGALICVFANPYALAGLPGIEQSRALLVGYQNDATLQRAGARVIAQQLRPSGKLPVTVNSFFRFGDGL